MDFNSCRQERDIYCDRGLLRFIVFIKPFKATFSFENEFLILKGLFWCFLKPPWLWMCMCVHVCVCLCTRLHFNLISNLFHAYRWVSVMGMSRGKTVTEEKRGCGCFPPKKTVPDGVTQTIAPQSQSVITQISQSTMNGKRGVMAGG